MIPFLEIKLAELSDSFWSFLKEQAQRSPAESLRRAFASSGCLEVLPLVRGAGARRESNRTKSIDPVRVQIMPTESPEQRLCQLVKKFAREHLGHGPEEAHAHLLNHLAVVHCRGPLTKLEAKALQATDSPRTQELARRQRHHLVDLEHDALRADVQSLLGHPVKAVLTDVCTRTGESVFVFLLEGKA